MNTRLVFIITTFFLHGTTQGERIFFDSCCRDIREEVNSMQDDLQNTKTDLATLKAYVDANLQTDASDSAVPIGFIYVQFPSQKPPATIWPKLTWTDVTSNYAGAFFRAEGGGSEAFGTSQDESCPKIKALKVTETALGLPVLELTITDNTATNTLNVGTSTSSPNSMYLLNVEASGYANECRPKNFAVKIWMRIAS